MQVSLVDPVGQTQIFIGLLLIVLLCSIRRRSSDMSRTNIIPLTVTHEIKGFAVLAIIFAHIGYVLSVDDHFLSPLSAIGGVGVDLFLFVSGFGLAMSAIKKQLTPAQFYLRRASKIFLPLWLSLVFILSLDWFVSQRMYSVGEIVRSFFGYFPLADVWININSPLWFITPLLLYYLVFPFFFKQKYPILSALLIFFAGSFFVDHLPERFVGVEHLYRLHTMAFPLGVFFAGMFSDARMHHLWQRITDKYAVQTQLVHNTLCVVVSGVCLALALYYSVHSGVGQTPFVEQYTSIGIALAYIGFFAFKPFEFRTLMVLGLVSFEMYLLHWPLLSRFDVWYSWLPASVATVIHISVMVSVGYILQYVCARLTSVFAIKKA
jgi:peptidoglycan/LPS O-acetylase OafA/YrhL